RVLFRSRRLDLDKPGRRHGRAQGGDQLRAAEEDGQRVGITEEVDLALPGALLDVGQSMPLLGRREQALGQEGDRLGEDSQLAGPGVADAAVDADQITEVEELGERPAQVADLPLTDEDLDGAGPVAELEEDDLPLTPAEHD